MALTLGGASHTVDVEGYFTDSVNGYAVSASPQDIVHTSRSGTEVTIKPIGAGSATVTVIGTKSGRDERKQFTVTVSAMVAAPTATGSIEAATVTEGATHAVTASDYFDGEGAMYTAESSDPGVATVGGGWRSGDSHGGRGRERDGDGHCDERGRKRRAGVRHHGRTAPRRPRRLLSAPSRRRR